MKARSRGPTVKPIAVNPDVEATSSVLIAEVRRDRFQLLHEVVCELLPAFRRAEHAGQLSNVR